MLIAFSELLKPWHKLPIVVIDFETTGSDPSACMPVEIACVRLEGGKLVASHAELINPGVPIEDGARAVHGISDEAVQGARFPFEAIERALDVVDAWDCLPCGYSGQSFDRVIMQRIMPPTDRSGLASDPGWPWLDPLVAIRSIDRYVKGKGRHQLGQVCTRRDIKLEGAHRALADVTATGRLLFCDDVFHWFGGNITAPEALAHQLRIAAQQQRDFDAWKARQPPLGTPVAGD